MLETKSTLLDLILSIHKSGNDLWHKNIEKYGEEKWKEISRKNVMAHNLLYFEQNDDKVEKIYNKLRVWQSPLVDFLYNRD